MLLICLGEIEVCVWAVRKIRFINIVQNRHKLHPGSRGRGAGGERRSRDMFSVGGKAEISMCGETEFIWLPSKIYKLTVCLSGR